MRNATLDFLAGWHEMAVTLPPSGKVPEIPFFFGGSWRTEVLKIAQKELGGTVGPHRTKNGKDITALFMTSEEWIEALTLLTPHYLTDRRVLQTERLINSIHMKG